MSLLTRQFHPSPECGRALVLRPLRPHSHPIPLRLPLGPEEVLAVRLAARPAVDLGIPHRHQEEVDVELLIPDHGKDALVLVGAVRFDLDDLPANQVVEVLPGLLAKGLAGFVAVGDLGGDGSMRAG